MPPGAIVFKQFPLTGIMGSQFFHRLHFFAPVSSLLPGNKCIRVFCCFFKIKSRTEDFKLQELHSITLEILWHIIQISDTYFIFLQEWYMELWLQSLFCLYVGTRLISHPSTFINQEGKFLWSHCNKDSPVISFMDTWRARRHSHSVNQCSPNTQIQFNKKNFQLYFYVTRNKERFQWRKCPFIAVFISKPTLGHF